MDHMLSLSDLVLPSTPEKFLGDYWGKAVHRSRLSDVWLNRLKDALSDLDIDTLLERERGEAGVRLRRRDGNYDFLQLPPSEAKKLFDAGHTVLLPDMDVPVLEEWHQGLCSELGRSWSTKMIGLFLGPKGSHTRWHFDQIENVTIQLRGRRTWRVASNTAVQKPIHNYSTKTRMPLPPGILLYADQDIPDEIAEEDTFVVTPGDVTYIPRGHWHDVEGTDQDEDSIAVIIAFPCVTWRDVLIPALEQTLVRQLSWRESALLPWGDGAMRARALTELEKLRIDLKGAIDRLDLEDLLPCIDRERRGLSKTDPKAGFVRNGLVVMQRAATREGNIQIRCHRMQGELSAVREAEIPQASEPLVSWILTKERFTTSELADATGFSYSAIHEILDTLVRLGFVRESLNQSLETSAP